MIISHSLCSPLIVLERYIKSHIDKGKQCLLPVAGLFTFAKASSHKMLVNTMAVLDLKHQDESTDGDAKGKNNSVI